MFYTIQPPIYDLFKNRFYTIPDFQREFVWKEENVDDLFTDISEETKHYTKILDDGKYFLGNIVVIGNWEENRTSYNVIDGQQRITTLMLLFKLLEQEMIERNLKDSFNRLFLSIQDMYGDFEEDTGAHKVRLSYERDLTYANLLTDYMEGEVPDTGNTDSIIESESERNLREVYNAISGNLREHDNDELIYLAKYLRDRVFVSVTSTEDMSVAYRVFETLNKRGKELDATDLIKNRLISYIVNNNPREDDKEKFVKLWNETINSLTRTQYKKDIVDTSKFLKHYIIGMFGENVTKSEIFNWFNFKIEEEINSPADVIRLAKDLKKAAELYGDLYRGKYESFETTSVKNVRITLQVLGYQQMYSLFIMFRDRSDEEKSKIASVIMRYAAMLVFTKTQANQAEERIEHLANEYRKRIKDGESQEALTNFIEEIETWIEENSQTAELLITREQFEDRKGELNINGRKLLKLLAIMTSENEEGELKKWSVEHIMPIQVSVENLINYNLESAQEHSRYKNRIGNLTPLESDLNTSGSNKSYEEKLEVYKETTNYLITKRIHNDLRTVMQSGSVSTFYEKINNNTSSYNDWDKTKIEERSNEIAKLFVKIINNNF